MVVSFENLLPEACQTLLEYIYFLFLGVYNLPQVYFIKKMKAKCVSNENEEYRQDILDWRKHCHTAQH